MKIINCLKLQAFVPSELNSSLQSGQFPSEPNHPQLSKLPSGQLPSEPNYRQLSKLPKIWKPFFNMMNVSFWN